MNAARVTALADAIEAGHKGLGFNMAQYRTRANTSTPDQGAHNCGTVACIGGWAEALFGESGRASKLDPRRAGKSCDPLLLATYLLDLTAIQGIRLMCPNASGYGDISRQRLDRISQASAVATLRHLAATGNVAWRAAP
jgi:hypothetical protein